MFAGQLRILIVAFLSFVVAGVQARGAEPLRVMSFNIRYGSAKDGDNHWDKRRDLVIETIRDFSPDLLGTQETLGFQAEFLRQQLPQHTYIGWSRDQDESGEQCGILFLTERFKLLDSGQFWLSTTPDEKYSKSWDSSLPRVATWARLRDLTNSQELLFLNTHFDHRGEIARLESAKAVRTFVESQSADLPVIVTGDFNCGENSEPHHQLTDSPRLLDTRRERHPTSDEPEGTFNGFRGTTSGARIDWILVSRAFNVVDAEIDRSHRDDRYPSDHFPVTAVLHMARP